MSQATRFTSGDGSAPSSTSEQITAVMDQTKEKAVELAGQAKDATGDLVTQATEQAKPRLESGKEQVAQTLTTTADALRRTSSELTDEQSARVGKFAESAAGQAERAAEFFESHDLGQIVSEVEAFARRQPALFLGAAFGIGLLGARFLRTSGEGQPSSTGQRTAMNGWQAPAGGSGPTYESTGYQPARFDGAGRQPDTGSF